MQAKKQYNTDMEGVAPQYTRPVPLAVYNRLYADDNRLMSQNKVANQYGMTPSAIGWLVKENILLPRFIVTEDNSPRVLMKLFSSDDVDFVAGMRMLTGWDYVGLSKYWQGRVFVELDIPTYFVQGSSTYTEIEKQRVALDTNYYRQVKLEGDEAP